MNNNQKTMTGTDKQIAWASKILDKWNLEIDAFVAEAKTEVEAGEDPMWLEIVKKAASEVRKGLIDRDAGKIIDARITNMGMQVESRAMTIAENATQAK